MTANDFLNPMPPSMPFESLRYPIGRFASSKTISPEQRQQYIAEIERLPQEVIEAVEKLANSQLDTPYREGGWTIRQVVHHIPDSHINAYVRFKWTLTEEQPTIKPYFEDRWAELSDAKNTPVNISLNLLEALHQRWVVLLKDISESGWAKKFTHPDSSKETRLDTALATYAWHGKHHLAHIQSLKTRMGWQ